MPSVRNTTLALTHEAPELRLASKVAWMYHEEGRKQAEIADELHISQSRVSRLLKFAVDQGIVRTIVTAPQGVFTELEGTVEKAFALDECVLVESVANEEALLNNLGVTAAHYLTATLTGGDRIGISSWSATWLAAARALPPFRQKVADEVVQLVGGVGDPQAQTQATLLLDRFSRVTGGQPVPMQTPGILGDASAQRSLMRDASLSEVVERWNELTVALVGIGSVEPSPLLRASGTIMAGVVDQVSELGGVGDICFRYFDAQGQALTGGVDARVAGISERQLLRIPRRVGLAGGVRKHAAILGAVRGKWISVLITDTDTAQMLLDNAG